MIGTIPLNGETWLICGGRDFRNGEMFGSAMADLCNRFGMPAKIIHGMATGADMYAEDFAREFALDVQRYPADWDKHGKAAGPIRNQQMLDKGKPHKVVAFPGGKGTADMVARARKAGVDVVEIKPS